MSITIVSRQFAAECPTCLMGRLFATQMGAQSWINAHTCRGSK